MDGKAFLDEKVNERREKILSSKDEIKINGTTYYVSCEGDDSNDGLGEGSAWRTLAKVSSANLSAGDGVLFKRGDLFRGEIFVKDGVSYGAYGVGEKPKIYGWDKSLAAPALWELYDEEHSIWHLKEKILDVGTLVFNDGEFHSIKLIPSYINGKFVCRENEDKPFLMEEEMVRNLDIYWHFDAIMSEKESRGSTFPIPDMTPESYGDLYLRCDEGNPGEIFNEIEALVRRSGFVVGSRKNVTIDNLCIKFVGLHAIAAGGQCVVGLRVTNCEIGWIGGTIQNYYGLDPNFKKGGRGSVTRFGNGVEIYGGCDGYEVSGCYIYEVYDAGATHQITTGGKTYVMKNIKYADNLFVRCVYGIEYFLEILGGGKDSYMKDVVISNNVFNESGCGWGQQRHNTTTPAHIKGWSFQNPATSFVISDNLFGKAGYRMLHLVADEAESLPKMQRNIYIQTESGMIGQYGVGKCSEPKIEYFDNDREKTIRESLGDKEAVIHSY